MVEHIWGRLAQSNGSLCDAQVLCVPVLGEVVSVVDQALAAPNWDDRAAGQVGRRVVLDLTQVQAWVVGKNGGLGELLASKEHGEGVLTVVGLDDFLDLDCVVREEVVASVVLVAAVVAVVLPHDGEGEYLAVVVEEALEVLVGTSTFEHDFDVVLVFGQIWGVLLHVDHGAGVHEGVVGVAFRGAKSHTLVGEE